MSRIQFCIQHILDGLTTVVNYGYLPPRNCKISTIQRVSVNNRFIFKGEYGFLDHGNH